MSEDYGATWQSLKGNLPEVVVNDLVQDPVNPDLLYLGTDHGTYVSLDKGSKWHVLSAVPNVASYDLMVHPRENELIIATHGRSMYVADVKPLQHLAGESIALKAFTPADITHSEKWGEKTYPYLPVSEPMVEVRYFVSQPG